MSPGMIGDGPRVTPIPPYRPAGTNKPAELDPSLARITAALESIAASLERLAYPLIKIGADE